MEAMDDKSKLTLSHRGYNAAFNAKNQSYWIQDFNN